VPLVLGILEMSAQPTSEILRGLSVAAIAHSWVAEFDHLLCSRDFASITKMFLADNSYWRDLAGLTWDLRTFKGARTIGPAIEKFQTLAGSCRWSLDPTVAPIVAEQPNFPTSIQAFLTFETPQCHGRGHVRLVSEPDSPGSWRVWTLMTTIESFKAFPEKTGKNRPVNYQDPHSRTATWIDERERELRFDDRSPEVLIVGAGHAGLTLAARLKQLAVDTLVVERNDRVGDNWRKRYRSLTLHNEVSANHMPYVPFPETWPVFTPKDKLADWLEAYVSTLDLNVWTTSTLAQSEFNAASKDWSVKIRRRDGSVKLLRPKHLVLATGAFGKARTIAFPGAEVFRGSVMRSDDFGFGRSATGQRALVIGTGSSGHDIAHDLWRSGAQVTMLQRNSTCVLSVLPSASLAYKAYGDENRPIQEVDLLGAATPLPLLREFHKDLMKRIAELDRDLLEGLARAGFVTDFGEDGSGFLMKYYEKGGGYYLNVGASELIVSGHIRIKQGVEVERLTETGVRFTDGSTMEADLVITAFGYGDMQESIRELIGHDVAERVGRVWGLDAEGEVRGMWRRTRQDCLWMMGGSFVQCRLYSKVLAAQLKAALEGFSWASDWSIR